MVKLKLKRVGKDSWDRPVYQDENGFFYKDTNLLPLSEIPKELCVSSPKNDFDGEPDYKITNFEIVNPPSERQIREETFRGKYMLLSRLQQDCKYFLGYGDRRENVLWAGNVVEQISKMKEIWNGFPEDLKPEWCTWEQICEYEKLMIA